jgi:hypothetical protein
MALAVVLFSAGAVAADTTVDPNGDLNGPRTVATVSITTQCTSGDTAALTVYIFQSVGRLINIGIGNAAPTCTTGVDVVSSVDVAAIPGLKFQPGPATLLVHTETDDGLGTITKSDSGAKVTLKP